MIPLTLRLSNFLSYRGETVLDLRQVHVACLCGDNGHGKSALLDAITWALWGWARGRRYGQGGASHDELVHQGQTEMEVDLEFEADGAVYQVVRKYSRGARGRSSATLLDLQAARRDRPRPPDSEAPDGDAYTQLSLDGAPGGEDVADRRYRTVAGGSVADTERQLLRLLRMDYETFVSSAFLLQGQADRFTTSTPTRRKETLAEILGLGLYERLEERARERVRRHDAALTRTGLELERLDAQAARWPEHQDALAAAEAALREIAPRLQDVATDLESVRGAVQALEIRERDVIGLREGIKRGQEEAQRLEAQVVAVGARAAEHREALVRRDEALDGVARLEEGRRRLLDLEEAQIRHNALTQERLGLEHAIAQARQGLEGQASGLEERVRRELAPRSDRLPVVERSLSEVADGLASLQGGSDVIRAQRATLEGLVREAESLRAENIRLLEEMKELRERFDMLVPGQTRCPLCGSDLGAEEMEHVRQETESRGLELRERYRANEARVRGTDPERERLEDDARLREQRLEAQQRGLLAEQGALGRELEECRRAQADLVTVQKALGALQEQIADEGFADDERRRLQALRADLDVLAYDPDRHAEVRAGVADMEPYADLDRRVREAAERLPQDESVLRDLEGLLDGRRRDIAETEGRLAASLAWLRDLPGMRVRAEALSADHRCLGDEQGRLQGQAHLYAARLRESEGMAAEAARLRDDQRRQEESRGTYALLVEAFGKRGVQALLIEECLPQLEDEANALLARLTDSRMHLRLESQRQTRRGDTVETLEIRIGDELGTRSYELFSGGEALRINFALRVALAKLLASRTGAPLRTLFLDEGFGTQDAAGRERLVEAIHAIQDEFDLILVITHIEELKDAFPVRIEVTKGDQGSTLEVVWS